MTEVKSNFTHEVIKFNTGRLCAYEISSYVWDQKMENNYPLL
jgi:hypothetical protein